MASIRTTKIGDTLTIKKIAQVHGYTNYLFLTNHSDHPACLYPKTSDPGKILVPGTKLIVVGRGKAETKYKASYVTVKHGAITFDIRPDDLRKFCI